MLDLGHQLTVSRLLTVANSCLLGSCLANACLPDTRVGCLCCPKQYMQGAVCAMGPVQAPSFGAFLRPAIHYLAPVCSAFVAMDLYPNITRTCSSTALTLLSFCGLSIIYTSNICCTPHMTRACLRLACSSSCAIWHAQHHDLASRGWCCGSCGSACRSCRLLCPCWPAWQGGGLAQASCCEP